MISAFSRAIGQLTDPAIRRYLWFVLAGSLAIFIILWVIIGAVLLNTALFELAWLETTVDILGGAATLVLTWLLFPSVASVVVGFFLEGVAAAVEARHYPGLGAPRSQGVTETVVSTLKFAAVAVGLNLLVLPLYLVPVLNIFVFYVLNGYLLSREFFELVALRRVDAAEVSAMRRDHRNRLLLAGAAIAFLLTLPVINLLAPVLATAVMVHLFQRWRPEGGPAAQPQMRSNA